MRNASSTTRPAALRKCELERLALFRYRLRQFLRASEVLCKRHGVTSLQYQLLLQVLGFEGRAWASVGELAERLQAHHHGVVALIDRCERAGLLERRHGRDDQRVVEVHLLPKGERLVAALAALHQDERRRLLAELAPAADRSRSRAQEKARW